MAAEKIQSKKTAKEQAVALAKAAAERVESLKQALETAIQESAKCESAVLEAENAVQEAVRESSQVEEEDEIQKIVDERNEARHNRDYKKADRLRDVLRNMGVQVNDSNFTWTGPGGLTGQSLLRRPGDWECVGCGFLCFAPKDRCFKCGTMKSGEPGDDRKGKDKRRRSPSSGSVGNRRGSERRKDDRGRRRRRDSDSEDSSPSRSPPRRRR